MFTRKSLAGRHQSRLRKSPKNGRQAARHRTTVAFEPLEERQLLAIDFDFGAIPTWVEQGPRPIQNGQLNTLPTSPAGGAVQAIAVNPTNANNVIVATVAGGLWETNNAGVNWTPLTDDFASTATASVAFSPLDANTIYAGTGMFSNGFEGTEPIGALRSTDGGTTWTLLGNNVFGVPGSGVGGRRIKEILPTSIDRDPGPGLQQVVLAAVINGIGRDSDGSRDPRMRGGGLFRSDDNGQTWTQEVGMAAGNLPAGTVTQVIADPNLTTRFYVGVPGQGVFLGDFNTGTGVITWTGINTNLTNIAGASQIELAAHDDGANTVLYAGISTGNALNGVWRSTDNGTTWNPLAAPPANFSAGASFHEKFNMVADPTQNDVVYISGQGGGNFIFRYNPAGGGSWVRIEGAGNTANGTNPHADARDLEFLNNTTLLTSDDGGIYFMPNPLNAIANDWMPFVGDLGVIEFYDIAFDTTNNVIFGGTQDNGSNVQTATGALTYNRVLGGDGQVQNYDPVNDLRYSLSNNFDSWFRSGTKLLLGANATDVAINNVTPGDGMNMPVRITSNNHGLMTGQAVVIQGVTGTTGANGIQVITVIDANNFDLMFGGSNNTSTGAYLGGGTWRLVGLNQNDALFASAGGPFNNELPAELNIVDPDSILFGRNGVYEGLNSMGDVIADISANLPGFGGNQARSVAYGGRRGGANQPNVAFVGDTGGGLWFRGEMGAAFTRLDGIGAGQIPSGQSIEDIVLDPDDWRRVYVVRGMTQVWMSNDVTNLAANPFINISSNIGTLSTDLKTIAVFDDTPATAGDAVVFAGGAGGVFRLLMDGTWVEFGQSLPNAITYDLEINEAVDLDGNPLDGTGLFVAGTFGRGAWIVQDLSTFIDVNPPVLTICGDEDFVNQDDTFVLIRSAANPANLQVYINNNTAVPDFEFPIALISQINVFGIGGNDTLIVDSSNGLIDVPLGIRYDGDGLCPEDDGPPPFGYDRGFDTLQLIQTGGPGIISDTLNVGAESGSGVSTIVGQTGTQQVFFQNLEPVIDGVPAPSLVINGGAFASILNASNAINYQTSDLFGATWGQVTIDNFEPIHFTNKMNLTIDAEAGSDSINLNNPSTPTALTSITILGSDPTASDLLVANGTTGVDAITFTPTGADNGSIAGAGPVPITFSTIEHVTINGQGGADTLTYQSPAGGSLLNFIPGATVNSGTVTGRRFSGQGGEMLVPMDYTNIDHSRALAQVIFANAGGRADDLVVFGSNGSDIFTVAPNGGNGSVLIENGGGVPDALTHTIDTRGISNISLKSVAGNDTFNLTGPLPYTRTVVDADATVNLAGASGPVTVNLGDNTPGSANPNTVITGYGGSVVLIGIDTANLDANNNQVTATGTTQNDNIIYTPTGATAGTFYDDVPSGNNLVPNTVFNIANVTGNFRVFNDPAGNADQVTLRGTAARDLIQINQSNGVAQVLANNVTLLLPLELGISAEILNALGLGGQDTFQVIPGVGIGGQAQDNLLINVDGGASGENNALVVAASFGAAPATLPATSFVVVNRGRTPDTGTVRVFQNAVANPDINYKSVQVISPIVAGTTVNPNSLFIGPDNFEQNDQLGNAAFLGADSSLQVQHASVFPNSTEFPGVPSDQDFYRVVTQTTGTLDFQVYFRTFAVALLPGGGQINLELYDVDGTLIASAPGIFGAAPGTGNARIRIPAVEGQTYYLRVFGATADVVNGYDITVIDTAAPVPFDIELLDTPINTNTNPPGGGPNSDTGRSQFDNVTFDNDPTILIRVADSALLNDIPDNNGNPGAPPAGIIAIPFVASTANNAPSAGFRVAVFVTENNTHTQVGYASQVPGSPGVYTFTFPTDFLAPDGSYFISARVEMVDPYSPEQNQGFGDFAQSLEIVVDTLPPNVSFGDPANPTDGLVPDSDSGVSPPNPDTLIDRITNDVTPTFWGRAEANSIIRLFVDVNGNGTFQPGVDVFIGQDTAIPLDGTNQEPDGYWEIESIVNFNDPTLFPVLDGLRTVFVTAEDLAGNINPGVGQQIQQLQIFVDTQGPQVTSVFITEVPGYDLFNPKGTEANLQGPTPLVDQLSINFRDLPARVLPFLYRALKDETVITDHFQVIGDQNGRIAIKNIILVQNPVVAGQPATATVTLEFFAPLPDDRFTLVITDEVRDIAGNRLDGETNAAEPQEDPRFPSGDGIPGGDFVARFTVDSTPELGVYAGIRVYLDLNGNAVFDPEGQDNDAVNRDLVFRFGSTSDALFAGKFVNPAPRLTPPAVANRFFDQVAAYGNILGTFRWLFDFNSDGVADLLTTQPANFQINGIPVAGNFDGNFANGDEVGLFDGVWWWRDTNHDFVINGLDATPIRSQIVGYPQVGDIDGDALDDFVTFQNDTYFVDFAADGLGVGFVATVPLTLDGGGLGFPGVSERPAVADMNQDGIDDLGIWVPGNVGQTPTEISEWYFLVSQALVRTGDSIPAPSATHVPGTPVPLPATPVEPTGLIPAYNTLWAFPSHSGLNATPHFQPVPFGTSLFAVFGDEPAFPLVGNFDPPTDIGGAPDEDPTTGTLEDNNVLIVAAGPGAEPRVRVYDRATGDLVMDILAYDVNFRGGVQVATGDVNGDGITDIITAPGAGGGPHIRVFDGATGSVLRQFFAYDPNFTGGVFVAAGDFTGDGKADIVTGAGAGGGPHVRIFNSDGAGIGQYYAYAATFTGGVHVAVGDVNGDGKQDVVTGPGASGGPHVRALSGTTSNVIHEYFVYAPTFTGGVWVATGDVNGDNRDDIITGAGATGGPHVTVVNSANGQVLYGFFAYDPAFTGGVRVASGDFDGDGRADILTGPGTGGGPHVRAFDGDNLAEVASFLSFAGSFTGGVFVAAPAASGGQALRAASEGSGAASISQEEFDLLVAAAISQWEMTSLFGSHNLRTVRVELADLPGTTLGLAYGDLVLIDADAAGHGWSLDGDAAGIDLLTAIEHELGHVLGFDDLDADADHVMAGELAAGVQHRLAVEAVDRLFAEAD